jgi:hypothetical protein
MQDVALIIFATGIAAFFILAGISVLIDTTKKGKE